MQLRRSGCAKLQIECLGRFFWRGWASLTSREERRCTFGGPLVTTLLTAHCDDHQFQRLRLGATWASLDRKAFGTRHRRAPRAVGHHPDPYQGKDVADPH